MTYFQANFHGAGSPELTAKQRQVIELLRTAKSQKYSLADWYLGAICAANNIYNPDRFSQAAQSLRELLEKFPRVFVESKVQDSKINFRDMRESLSDRLSKDKNNHANGWDGEVVDSHLDKTICYLEHYLELNQIPTRGEQISSVMHQLDPMHDTLDQGIRFEKYELFRTLWKTFEGLAHHNTNTDEKYFQKQLMLLETLIINLLAPTTAQNQGAIQEILAKPQPGQDDFKNIFELIQRRGANYAYFFKTVDSPIWITPLVENGFFKNPPNVETVEDDRIITPLWLPIFYLQRVSEHVPKKVVEIILEMEPTNNPRILWEIFSIACDLQDTKLSLRLKPLVKQFLESPYRWRWGEEELIIKILHKWGAVGCSEGHSAAHEIAKYVIAFQLDSKEKEKRAHHKENPEDLYTPLEPFPRFNQSGYKKILKEGIRPLAEHKPYEIAEMLIKATNAMLKLKMYEPVNNSAQEVEDYSEYWCRRLDKSDSNYQDIKGILVQTLVYACKHVYDKEPESIAALDEELRKYSWKVFKRLQQHLYALHPNDKTLPWIREQILEHVDYSRRGHHYEFQLMIRKASEHFGTCLLSECERTIIFNDIRSGPSKENFQNWGDEQDDDEAFQQHQRYFHRKQLHPFAKLLSGEVRSYFDRLQNEVMGETISDDSYLPCGEITSGAVTSRSPKSVEELESLTDEELVSYLNDWDEEHRDSGHSLVRINIPALADVFQLLFKEKIVHDGKRLKFWMTNRDKIARPIYVAAMVKTMQELVKDKNFGNLGQWIDFCAWVLSHQDSMRTEEQPEPQDKSSDHPNWRSSHRAVVDFIELCVNQDTNAPITARDGLAQLLKRVCSQFDWRLDHERPVLLNCNDLITEAFNKTRSRALDSLVSFGFWIKRHSPEDKMPEVTDILAMRIATDGTCPLTRPEQALLGMQFGNLCALNQDWAVEHLKIIFPRGDKATWRNAFGSYIRSNHPVKTTFDILRSEFEYAIENLNGLIAGKDDGKEFVDRLGQHLFRDYLWEAYTLMGDESLLRRFYDKTKGDRKLWAQLFNHVGILLRNSGSHMDETLTDRIIAFFDWRLKEAESLELQEFTFWLQAECLDPEWRLQSYSKILDLRPKKDIDLFIQMEVLKELLPNHLALIVECFAKITDDMDNDTQMYISATEAKPILKAGLNAEDHQIRKNAERAKENLLRIGNIDHDYFVE